MMFCVFYTFSPDNNNYKILTTFDSEGNVLAMYLDYYDYKIHINTLNSSGEIINDVSVQPSFDWSRLAQRVPVRIRLETIPEGVQLVSGITASVVIRPKD